MNLVIYYDKATDRIEVEEFGHIINAKDRAKWLRERGAVINITRITTALHTINLVRN